MAIAKDSADFTDFGPDGAAADFTRRLSDKILAAFNHAYAVGEVEMAKHLRKLLEKNEHARSAGDENRTEYDPVRRADLWVAFVEQRNRYHTACESGRANAKSTAKALEEMKDAYRLWCQT